VSGRQFFVDPVGGDDDNATGSGTSSAGGATTATPSCAFRTLT
jgi:hypothetical protein